ncbi:MAG: GAF domain-containing protein [Bacteroidales bacterium]|nr:GAF domain-containing protein [Bacteroidales bacterium]
MKYKMKLRTKMIVLAVVAIFIIMGSFGLFVGARIYKQAVVKAKVLADNLAKTHATELESRFNYYMGYSKGLANSFNNYTNFRSSDFRGIHNNTLIEGLNASPEATCVWASFEYSQLKEDYEKDHGRMTFLTKKDGRNIIIDSIERDMDNAHVGSDYHNLKLKKGGFMAEPYSENSFNIMMTTFMHSVYTNNKYAGCAGIDISLEDVQKIVKEIKVMNGGSVMVLSNGGTIIGHSADSYVGKNIQDVLAKKNKEFRIAEKIKKGENCSFSFEYKGDLYYTTFSSFTIKDSDKPWSFGVTLPISLIIKETYNDLYKLSYLGFACMLIFSLLIALFARSITRPLVETTNVFDKLSRGDIRNNNRLKINSGDEIEDMGNSVNQMIDGLQKTENFAREIERGNLDAEYELLSEEDSLGKALIEMRNSLKDAKEKEAERKEEEEKQNWATKGIAMFADIMRNEFDNTQEMGYSIISNLIKYTNANQGGIFLINNNNAEDEHIELIAAYAYNRRKFLEKKILIGEGLIGRCYQEAKTIYMTDLPSNYIQITSGLGEETPRSLAIVPMVVNEQVIGIIELASFTNLDKYKIDFIEKVGENIASSIASLRVNLQTSELLKQTKEQAEEMKAQEEEMRQNMEELLATQEESSRREETLKVAYQELEATKDEENQIITILSQTIGAVHYDNSMTITSTNEYFADLLNTNVDDLIGKKYTELPLTNSQDETQEMWSNILAGHKTERTTCYKIADESTINIKEKFIANKDKHGKILNFVCIAMEM